MNKSTPSEDRLTAGFTATVFPAHLRPSMLRYVLHGNPPAGFLDAVLANDLRGALLRGTVDEVRSLPGSILPWLLTYAPSEAWGSRAAVLAWTTTPDSD